MIPIEFPITLRRGEDFVQRWSLTDEDTGVSLIAASDTLSLTVRPIRGDSATLTLVSAAVGSSGLSGFDYTAGSFDLTIRTTQIDAIASALSLSVRQFGQAHWALDVTGADSLVVSYAHGALYVEPNT